MKNQGLKFIRDRSFHEILWIVKNVRDKKRSRKSWKYDPRRHRSKNYTIYSTYLLRYGIVLVPAGIGCIINGRERGKGCSADTADRLSADLGTSTTDIFVQRSRTLK